jgi:hypothetical protein
VFVGKNEDKPVWCPLEYEFLQDFCYTCGLIGHIDKVCGVQLEKGASQQYSRKLRCIPRRRSGTFANDRFGSDRGAPAWRVGGSGSKLNYGGFGRSLSGRDGPSWRKSIVGVGARGSEVQDKGG